MNSILVTNDDGIDSPALPALVRRLADLAPVHTAAPDQERSWISKAITRYEEVTVRPVERDGIPMYAVSGYPADCTQLGINWLFEGRPDLVVSGINIGFNHGAAFLMSSGTIGAAAEAWISGIPSIALSAGPTTGPFRPWGRWAKTADAVEAWDRLAEVSARIVGDIIDVGFPEEADLVSVNLPADAGLDTPIKVTSLARIGYDRLFEPLGDGRFVHKFGGGLVEFEGLEGSDIAASAEGAISVTPILVPHSGRLRPELADRLQRPST